MRLAARTLRLGYNVMFLDTDLIIFDDPYKWFKGGPLASHNLMFAGGACGGQAGSSHGCPSTSLVFAGWACKRACSGEGCASASCLQVRRACLQR